MQSSLHFSWFDLDVRLTTVHVLRFFRYTLFFPIRQIVRLSLRISFLPKCIWIQIRSVWARCEFRIKNNWNSSNRKLSNLLVNKRSHAQNWRCSIMLCMLILPYNYGQSLYRYKTGTNCVLKSGLRIRILYGCFCKYIFVVPYFIRIWRWLDKDMDPVSKI